MTAFAYRLPWCAALLVTTLLSACGGDGGSRQNPNSLHGTAAVGAGIASGTVSARCADGTGFTDTITTEANGIWRGSLASAAALPCALRVEGGTPAVTLYSLATRAGNVNITPLTDLALALQINALSGQALPDWFADPTTGDAGLDTLAPQLASAATALRTALVNAGYTPPGNWPNGSTAPFTAPFTANPASDPYDQLLEQLGDGSQGSGLDSHDALRASFTSGGSLPQAPAGGGGNGGGTSPATVHASLTGTYSLVFYAGGGEGCGNACDFIDEQAVSVVVGEDNTLSIDGTVLDNPYHRLFDGSPHLPEIIWRDGDVEYALSSNDTGTFNEINVGDASRPQGPFGVPVFIGQLRAEQADTPAAEKLGPLAGVYAPTLIEKTVTFSGNSALTPGSSVFVEIDAQGVVTVDGYQFDPADPSYRFNDYTTNPSRPEFAYHLSIEESASQTLSFDVIVSPDMLIPVAWRLTRTTQLGGGAFSSSTIELEERPLPDEETALLSELKALGDITLTVIEDDTSYNSGYVLCDELRLSVSDDGAVNSWRYALVKASNGTTLSSEFYRRSYGRYVEESGGRRIGFLRNHLVLREDGQVEVQARFLGNLKDRASSDPAEISAAGCASH
ncbi:hypothetical protein A167_02815 [Alcanivorax sp. S71-1-4]|uniref:hypothetical protein n=1 Tax=Alcanivorax sp. S71-1-4 TaxID=1177159 RepID=UPI00135922AA|nr:hypothetical protein [Alcanivorax sp. S71-1-4]KAF0807840.1 hypothetical protein A167_02815 [Alcanivorax sp. S71-1-4]